MVTIDRGLGSPHWDPGLGGLSVALQADTLVGGWGVESALRKTS